MYLSILMIAVSIRNYHTLLRNHGDSPPMDSIHSYEVPMDEHCAICNEGIIAYEFLCTCTCMSYTFVTFVPVVVPYSCFRGDSCPQGHYWSTLIDN